MSTLPTPRRLPPLLVKSVAIGLVLVALMGALGAVSGIVAEREGRLREAEASLASSLASGQTVLGPILQRECAEYWEATQGEGKNRKTTIERRDWKLLAAPAKLDIGAQVAIEPRHRGIFKVNGYVMTATLAASWSDGSALQPQREHTGSRLRCEAPSLFVALGDSRGVRSATVRLDGSVAAIQPGSGHAAHERGFHAGVDENWPDSQRPLAAQVAIELVGTGELAFAPVADVTRVRLDSPWPHPSFAGRFLPLDSKIEDSGFSARWEVNALATSAPQQVVAGASVCATDGGRPADTQAGRSRCIETFGVSFIDPVSTYTLSDRATKYGMLFIALTFLGVGAVEVMRRVRVHPVQYLLVGSAIALFFLLLVSVGEHVAFERAYLAASSACTVLLAFYASFVLRGARAGLAFGAAIGALYGVLFVLLQLEQTALLLGSMLLFAVLAVLMIATRRLDWYALLARMRSDGAPAGPAGPGA